MEQGSIASRIRARLAATGKSAASASLEAGLGRSAIQNILSGVSANPRTSTLEKLAGPLDCSLEFLMGVIGPLERHPGQYPFRVGLRDLDPQAVEYAIRIEDDVWRGAIEPDFLGLDAIVGHRDLRMTSSKIEYFQLAEHGWHDEGLKREDVLFTASTDEDGPLRIYPNALVVVEQRSSRHNLIGVSLRRVSHGSETVSLEGIKSRIDLPTRESPETMRVGERFDLEDMTISIIGLVVRISRGIEIERLYGL